ncbi:MAG: hypothetical protein P1V36_11235 [Planctomycetota bacterium]|nr:hypothetical protein [Planctomycetota bacterium]
MMLVLAAEAHKHPTWADFGPVEWVAIVVSGLVALWTIWMAVMYTVRPGEESEDHIKRSILDAESTEPDEALQAWIVEHETNPEHPSGEAHVQRLHLESAATRPGTERSAR